MSRELKLLKDAGCPEWVIEHSKGVSRKAVEIASNFDDADSELVRVGGLLHDIGRSKTNSIEHALIGASMLKDLGYSQDIVNIVERHIGTGLSEDDARELGLPIKDYTPQTIEEKIVSHADNLFNGADEVDVEFTVNKWKRKLGENHPSIEKIREIHYELVGCFE
ncbi:MAG: TIGR00295 family protein [Methanobrevibacter sp.]|nr:TIGR00295 family protein [Methanobrevibacter sp.]